MNKAQNQAYLPNTGAEDQRHFLSLAKLWPAVLDTPSTFPVQAESVTVGALSAACSRWDSSPTDEQFSRFNSSLCSQELREFDAWTTVLPFGSRLPEAFIVVSGLYIRIWARVRDGKMLSLLPVMQPLAKGVFGSQTAFTPLKTVLSDEFRQEPETQTVEMVICRTPGALIRVKSPFEFLEIDAFSKEVARSRDRDARWMQDRLFALQTNEDRAKAMIRSLTGLKKLNKLDSETYTFQCPVSQSALAEALELSDNTLRPYLKTRKYEWDAGKFQLDSAFAEGAKAEMGLTLKD